jgi:hypothetical protein
MYWDSITSILVVGLDEGKINLIKIPPENGFVRFDEIADVKFH